MRKKKIKILHVAQAAGGVDRYIRMLLKYLDIHKNSAIDILILKVLQRFPNIKVVVHSHNTFPSVGGKLEKLHKFNRKYLYDNADYRLACSDNAGKWMYGNGAFEIL